MSDQDELQPTRLPDGEVRMMHQPRQSPSLGRVVLFTPADPDQRANGAHEYVAFIGQVFHDPGIERPYCNLLTFPPFAEPKWEGSVQEALTEGAPRSWRWPPKVG